MPGLNTAHEVIAFDHAPDGGLAMVDARFRTENESEAIEMAERLAGLHAGVVAVRRDVSPAIGETGAPVVLYRAGEVGDFA